ncbi:reverse transcriptase domain protein [Colletotrichum tabaci]|uniref:Reverse transcriptase domain protein n=1 Tax=Colletotrichum tabaci TaxID=1209068 RepID=A0AAV9STZ8_9PEZI
MADQAAKEAAGFSPNADAHAAPPPEPKHCCRLLAILGAAGEWGARSIMVGGVLGFLGDGLAAHVDRSIGSF